MVRVLRRKARQASIACGKLISSSVTTATYGVVTERATAATFSLGGRRVELPPFDQPTTNPPQFGIGLFAQIRDDDAMPELSSTQKLNLRPTQRRPVERRQMIVRSVVASEDGGSSSANSRLISGHPWRRLDMASTPPVGRAEVCAWVKRHFWTGFRSNRGFG